MHLKQLSTLTFLFTTLFMVAVAIPLPESDEPIRYIESGQSLLSLGVVQSPWELM